MNVPNYRVARGLILSAWILAIPLAVWAAGEPPQPPSCQMQLAEKIVQSKNLDDDRDVKEQKIAALQVQIYLQNQTIKQMEEQLKKKAEEKPAEPPAEAPSHP